MENGINVVVEKAVVQRLPAPASTLVSDANTLAPVFHDALVEGFRRFTAQSPRRRLWLCTLPDGAGMNEAVVSHC